MNSFFIYLFFLKFILLNSACINGNNHCIKCDPTTDLCFKCDKDIYTPDEEGGCTYSNICEEGNNHCLECESEGKLCKHCEKNYFPDENGQCSYTKNCKISEKGNCLKCKDDYILIGKDSEDSIKICKLITSDDLKYCERINTQNGMCEKCQEGYYLNEGDKKCSTYENCYKSTYDICTICNRYYYLDKKENKCKEQKDNFEHCKESVDGKNCDICEDDFFFDKEGNCLSINFCEKKGDYGGCEECISGYYLSQYGGSCTPDINCASGIRDIGVCNICKQDYYINYSNGKCYSNQEDNEFKYCDNANDGQCIECISGFYIGKDNKCSFSNYCAYSENAICKECMDNYYLGLDNYCTNVKNCIYSYDNQCLECKENYYYNGINHSCISSEENFKNCKYSYNGEYCDSCKKDYYLNKTDHLCYTNKELNDFYKCLYTDYFGRYCEMCENGYFLGYKDHKCSKIENCDISQDGDTCIECCENCCFDVKTGKCEYNDEIISEAKKFYFRCDKTNEEGTRCDVCSGNYTLSEDGLCIDEEHCIEKDKEGKCLNCENSDEQSFCLNEIFGCVELWYDNCLECNNILEINKCTKCKDGYEIDYYNECSEIDTEEYN